MAEDIIDGQQRADANAAAIAAQASQDISGAPMGGTKDIADTSGALDSLMKVAVEAKKDAIDGKDEEGNSKAKAEAEAKAKADADAKAKADADSADKKKADDDAAKAGAAGADPAAKTPEQLQAEKDAADAQARADELFKDSPTLPPKASEKSNEAFKAVKLQAAKEISRLQDELDKITKEATGLREVSKKALTPEIETELEDLRKFRARLDVETDPKFKTFDKEISNAQEFIYAQLSKAPEITADVIEKIKKLGGPQNVKMEAVLAGISDNTIKRLVESKLGDIELKVFEKKQAIEATKANVSEYLAEREKQWVGAANSHTESTKAELNRLAGNLPWLMDQTADPKATTEQKAEVEEANKFAKEMRDQITVGMGDDSPEMRATLLLGMAQLFRLEKSHKALTAEHGTLTKELEKAQATIKRLTSASTSRLRDTGGLEAGGNKPPAPKPEAQFTEKAGDALDRIRAEQAAKRGQ